MHRRTLGAAAGAALATLAVMGFPSDEEAAQAEIRRLVVALSADTQNRNVSGVLSTVSDSFKGESLRDKQHVQRMLERHFAQNAWVRVFTTRLEMRKISDSEFQVSARLIVGRAGSVELKDLARDARLSTWAIDALANREADGKWRWVWARQEEVKP